jgi:tetratricopeptide (TPR) repeat protein
MSPVVPHKDLWNVANCYKAKGQLDEALRWYERFLQLNPTFAEGWNNLGEVAVRQALRGGKMDKAQMKTALDCFKQAASLDDHLSLAFNNMGFCCLKMADAKEALAAYNSALVAAAPGNNPLAHSGRAEALAALGRDSEALDELNATLRAFPDFVPALWTKAAVLARRGDTTEALQLARRAIALAPPATAAEIRADPALKAMLSPGKSDQER